MSGWTSDDRPFSTIFFFNGGQGARPDQDGISTLSFPTNVSTTPVEVLERGVPVRIRDKSLLPGSGGAGKFRGGLGQRIEMEITASRPVTLVVLSQRLNFPPRARQGGENGSLERILLNDKEVEGGTPFRLDKGDVITLELPGGGGFGASGDRAPVLHEADLMDGLA
jgi:N-methylhydantoinase B